MTGFLRLLVPTSFNNELTGPNLIITRKTHRIFGGYALSFQVTSNSIRSSLSCHPGNFLFDLFGEPLQDEGVHAVRGMVGDIFQLHIERFRDPQRQIFLHILSDVGFFPGVHLFSSRAVFAGTSGKLIQVRFFFSCRGRPERSLLFTCHHTPLQIIGSFPGLPYCPVSILPRTGRPGLIFEKRSDHGALSQPGTGAGSFLR